MQSTIPVLNLAVLLVIAILPKCMLAADQPNILWVTSEDHGPEMGCYGDKLARTPNVDALAAKGMMFKHAWSVAPVCAPARTAIISGMYPSSSGGLHMRSMVSMPAGTKMYPQYLREAGFYCTNNSKTDYNLREPGKVWDDSSNKAHWKNRAAGQPFFAIFNSTKSHESQIRTRPHNQISDPAEVRVPAYHPDTPEVREDWAQYYDKVSEADADAGRHLKEIADAGLADDTIVFYYGDHGSGMPRSKRWPSNSGLHVPMVVYFPKKWEHLAPKEYKAGSSSDRLVSFVDLAPTVLSLVGLKPPEWMQGYAFAGPHQSQPQPFIYGQRGRMDERMDMVRSVTDGRYVYLRNYMPHVSQAQRVAYQFETPTTRVWNELFVAGKTNAVQSIFWQVPKAVEELYDLTSDRDEIQNLAQSPEHVSILENMRGAQREHVLKIRDICFLPEPEIHTRSEGSTPYDTARDLAKIPLERIVSAAELSSRSNPADTKELIALLNDKDSAVRYWGALGLLIRGADTVSSNNVALQAALSDESPSVRIVAAQALGLYSEGASRASALKTLGTLASPEANGVLTAMPALAAIEALGDVAKPLHEEIAAINPKGPSPDDRYDSYVPRLIANIVPEVTEKPAKKRAKAEQLQAATQPNIVIFLADDAGWGDYSHSGNTQIRTPNIDSIAQGGVSLDRFYVCPVCAPTRAEFLTGRYHPRGGVRGVSTGLERLDLDEKTIADAFKAAGYATGAFGKWHNGSQWPYHPMARGFDEYFGHTSGHWGEYFDAPLEENGRMIRTSGYIVDVCTDRALGFIEKNKDKPFLCYVPFTTPHSPWAAPAQDWQRFKDKPITQTATDPSKEVVDETRCALAMLENQDMNVGRVLAKLKEHKLDENTLVLYFSDNGPNSMRWTGGMKGKKGTTDEGGVRSVCYLRWPAKIPAGHTVTQIAGAIDLLPTLTALTGVKRVGDKPLDGLDLSPLMLKQSVPWPDRMIFSTWGGNVSVRTQTHRLDNAGKLYDMLADPGQTKSINDRDTVRASKLTESVKAWREEMLRAGDATRPKAQAGAGKKNLLGGNAVDPRPIPVGYREFPITMLPARDGEPLGSVKRSSGAPNCSYFVNWTKKEDSMVWLLDVHATGRYEVTIDYTCKVPDAGSTVEVSFQDVRLTGKVEPGWDPPLYTNQDTLPRPDGESQMKDFHTLKLGEIALLSGQGQFTLRALDIPGQSVMDVRRVTITLVP